MSEIEAKINGKWKKTADFSKKRIIKFHGIKIPVMDLWEEYRIYISMGKKKKADKIKQFLQNS